MRKHSFAMNIKIPETSALNSDVRLFAPKASNVTEETMSEMYLRASFVFPKTFARTKASTVMSFVHTNIFASLASPDTGGYCDYCRLGCESCCNDGCTGCSYCCDDDCTGCSWCRPNCGYCDAGCRECCDDDCTGCSWCEDYDHKCSGCGFCERDCDCEFDDERPWRSSAHIRRYGW